VKSKSSGKVFYHGSTGGSGDFTTSALQPGAYQVDFRAPKA